jgi:hypothetical protein
MTTVFTLPGFVQHLAGLRMAMPMAERAALEHAAVIVETEAKRVLGTYDYGWPPLSPVTIARKATGDSPGLETGEMRDSIDHQVGHLGPGGQLEAHVGSNLDKAIWFELGTARQPPRSFLAQAAIRKEQDIADDIGRRITAFLSSGTISTKII